MFSSKYAFNLHPIKLYIVLLSALVISACASISHEQILQENTSIAQLELSLAEFERKGLIPLAPLGYESAMEQLRQAIDRHIAREPDLAAEIATKGIETLNNAKTHAATTRVEFEEVLSNRGRAYAAGAAQTFPSEVAEAEKQLRKATALIERGDVVAAKKRRPELINTYARIELKALQQNTMRKAEIAFKRAKHAKAEEFAPKTLKFAEEELQLALSMLKVNRDDRAKANTHADRAIALADKSANIAELAKEFEAQDYTLEDVILWYQKQLSTATQAMENGPQFDRDNRSTINELQSTIEQLVASNQQNRQQLQAKQEELQNVSQSYQQKISEQTRQQKLEQQRIREIKKRFDDVQSMFTRNEANVFLQKQNVLLTVHGFHFAPGGKEIESKNFPLLNKINQAINKFPNSYVVISGHTDSIGDADHNMELSEARAGNVARFLVDTAKIDAKRITVRGFGEEKPVATNENSPGRARNRRVEVLIMNQNNP